MMIVLIQNVEFYRPSSFLGNNALRWIDKNLPKCPLCKLPTQWEVGPVDIFQTNPTHFRCPKCAGVISIPPYGTRIPLVFLDQMLKERALDAIRIESVGSSKYMSYYVGKKLSLKVLQRWAN